MVGIHIGTIKDTLADFAEMCVGMEIKSVANRCHIPENAGIGSYAVMHLAVSDISAVHQRNSSPMAASQ